MTRLRASRWGQRVAAWPSAAVVGGSALAIFLASRVLPESAAWPVGLAATAPVAAYCLMRTTRRWDALWVWLSPSAVSTVVHDITGAPQWTIALPVLLVGLAVLACEDREERRARLQPA